MCIGVSKRCGLLDVYRCFKTVWFARCVPVFQNNFVPPLLGQIYSSTLKMEVQSNPPKIIYM